MPVLEWLGKGQAVRAAGAVDFRLLEEERDLSFGDRNTGNVIIHGDNLEALKALLPYYKGRVKCIYIDPPYNTGSAFAQYDDNLEHSTWLSLMFPRLELLREFLREDGSIWISIDDDEQAYLKVMCDEIFGRRNFIIDVIWRKRDGAPNDRKIGSVNEHILVFAKEKIATSKKTIAEENFNLMPRTEKANAQYRVFKEPNGPDPRGPFRKIDTTANGKGGRFVKSLFYPVINPFTHQEVWPREGTCWRHNKADMDRLQKEGRLYWGVNGTATTPMRKLYMSEAKKGMTTPSIWEDVGYNQHASSEIEKIFGSKAAFETPKPERLIERVLQVASNPGDLVLDSFLGSGTTAAVAQKMGRRYIGIEMEDTAMTHVAPRLRKVIDGEQGGISKELGWKGGGGFRFYHLGSTLYSADGMLNESVDPLALGAFIFYKETGTSIGDGAKLPYLGMAEDTAYYLLYNKEKNTVLDARTYAALTADAPKKVIYADLCRMGKERMEADGIVFRQIPYDILKLGK